MTGYEIELRRVSELKAYQYNSRTHAPEQLELIRASVDEFGWTRPVLVRDQTIAAGHGAVLVADAIYQAGRNICPAPGRAAGAAPFPFGMVPVIDASGWSNEQLRAYVVADNQIPLRAGWDIEMLRLEIDDLREVGFDLDLLGFDDEALDAILTGEAGGKKEHDDDADEFRVTVWSNDEAEILALKKLIGVSATAGKVEAHRVLGMLER